MFALRDQLVGDALNLLGLWDGGGDSVMQNERGGQVLEERRAMALVAGQLSERVAVPHYSTLWGGAMMV